MNIDQETNITHILIVLLVSVLLVVVISCCTSWCQNPGVIQDKEMGIQIPMQPPATTTIDHVIATLIQQQAATETSDEPHDHLPTMKEEIYKNNNIREEDECAICMEEFKEMELVQVMESWRHLFHTHCIYQWFFINQTCPICRQSI